MGAWLNSVTRVQRLCFVYTLGMYVQELEKEGFLHPDTGVEKGAFWMQHEKGTALDGVRPKALETDTISKIATRSPLPKQAGSKLVQLTAVLARPSVAEVGGSAAPTPSQRG